MKVKGINSLFTSLPLRKFFRPKRPVTVDLSSVLYRGLFVPVGCILLSPSTLFLTVQVSSTVNPFRPGSPGLLRRSPESLERTDRVETVVQRVGRMRRVVLDFR